MSSVRKRSGSWQARWWTADRRLTSETHKGWAKAAALKYAQAQEEASLRTPWVITTPSEGPDLIEYGYQVLRARAISEQRLTNDLATWRNRSVVVDLTGRYAPSTVRDTYGLIQYVFATAQADGLIISTPGVRISLPRRLPEDKVIAANPSSVQAISACWLVPCCDRLPDQ